jgi:hypothetical protein
VNAMAVHKAHAIKAALDQRGAVEIKETGT